MQEPLAPADSLKPHELRIYAAYLSHCSPEAAYTWLEQRATKTDAVRSWLFRDFSDIREHKAAALLEWLLLRRKHSLIDLGIAHFGRAPSMVKKAYARGRVGVRCAAWCNAVVAPSSILPRLSPGLSWYTHEDLRNLVERGTFAEVTALASNPSIGDELLVELIKRSGAFSRLSNAKYIRALMALGENPRLSGKYRDDDEITDPFVYVSYRSPFRAAWELTKVVPTTQDWAAVLNILFRNIREEPIEAVDSAIARWRIDEDGRPASFFLRRRLADLKLADQTLLESDDPALRQSFYKRFDPRQFKEWPKGFELDGELFIEAAVLNNHLWQTKNERNRLRELCDQHGSLSANYRNPFHAIDDRLRAEHPEWYHDGGDESEDKEGALRKLLLDVQAEVAKQNHIIHILLMCVLGALVVLALRSIR